MMRNAYDLVVVVAVAFASAPLNQLLRPSGRATTLTPSMTGRRTVYRTTSLQEGSDCHQPQLQ